MKKQQDLSLLHRDKELLEATDLPIITTSASFKEDLKGFHGEQENDKIQDVVFSRAHYSMALGIAVAAWGEKIDPKKAWLVDPTNHVETENWASIKLTDFIGQTIARQPILKTLKDLVDKFARSKLPILDSIAPATKYLVENIDQTILSFHIANGNILAEDGKQVLEMITDPHVRSDYVKNAHKDNIRFLVFDEETKEEFFKVAKQEGIKIPESQIKDKVIVTGPPVDPRIISVGKNKQPWFGQRPLRIVITTGGLGTNKKEIKKILEQLLPALKKTPAGCPAFELIYYTGTHADHKEMAASLAKKYKIRHHVISPHDPADFISTGSLNKPNRNYKKAVKFHIIYHPQIIDANELLIRYGFPWADLFISKPSGDMAYDAALSGSALLTLKEWGEWEHNVRDVFEKQGVGQIADSNNMIEQLTRLSQDKKIRTEQSQIPTSSSRPIPQPEGASSNQDSWITQAMLNTHKLPDIFYQGANNIIKAAQKS